MREDIASTSVERVAAFKLAGSEFAIPITDIHEIFSAANMSKVPLAPSFMNLIMNGKGRIVTIFDLSLFLFSQKRAFDEETRIILLRHSEMNIGILVKKILQIEFIAKNNIEELRADEKGGKVFAFTKGILRSEYTARVVNILDSEKIFVFCKGYEFYHG